jgi:hypothetical protein
MSLLMARLDRLEMLLTRAFGSTLGEGDVSANVLFTTTPQKADTSATSGLVQEEMDERDFSPADLLETETPQKEEVNVSGIVEEAEEEEEDVDEENSVSSGGTVVRDKSDKSLLLSSSTESAEIVDSSEVASPPAALSLTSPVHRLRSGSSPVAPGTPLGLVSRAIHSMEQRITAIQSTPARGASTRRLNNGSLSSRSNSSASAEDLAQLEAISARAEHGVSSVSDPSAVASPVPADRTLNQSQGQDTSCDLSYTNMCDVSALDPRNDIRAYYSIAISGEEQQQGQGQGQDKGRETMESDTCVPVGDEMGSQEVKVEGAEMEKEQEENEVVEPLFKKDEEATQTKKQ